MARKRQWDGPLHRAVANYALIAGLAACAGPALSACADGERLQRMMSAYATLVSREASIGASPETRTILSQPPEAYSQHVPEVREAIDAAQTLALSVEGRLPAEPPGADRTFRHLRRIGRLAEAIGSETCTPGRSADTPEALPPGETALGSAGDALASLRSPGGFPWSRIPLGPFALVTAMLAGSFFVVAWLRRQSRRRQFRRHTFGREVPVLADGETEWQNHLVADIGQGGLKLALREPTAAGRKLEVYLGGAPRDAVVTWCNAYYAGLRFRHALTPAELGTVLDEAGAAVATGENESGAPDGTPQTAGSAPE